MYEIGDMSRITERRERLEAEFERGRDDGYNGRERPPEEVEEKQAYQYGWSAGIQLRGLILIDQN